MANNSFEPTPSERLNSSPNLPGVAMRAALLTAFLALTSGCDQLDRTMTQLDGMDTVILSAQPFELNPHGRVLTSSDQMKTRGISSVCVALKSHYPIAPQPQMDRDFESLLQGANISATLVAENGSEYRLDGANQAWALDGAISSTEELSACVSSVGNVKMPEGTVIKSVRLRSDRPLAVLGAYWQSMPQVIGPES